MNTMEMNQEQKRILRRMKSNKFWGYFCIIFAIVELVGTWILTGNPFYGLILPIFCIWQGKKCLGEVKELKWEFDEAGRKLSN